MKLSFHGQSTVYFEANGKSGIIDPFITGNGQTDLNVEDLKVDYVILTHDHEDHFEIRLKLLSVITQQSLAQLKWRIIYLQTKALKMYTL